MPNSKIKVSFVPGWEHSLENSSEGLLERVGGNILDDMKAHCPVETGKLRDSLELEVDGDEARISSDLDYAPFVNLGTHDMPAQPFMKQAVYKRRVVK